MYYKFYGFKEPPFNMTPNSKFFFQSAKHSEALDSLLYAISERKGFVVITGEIGSGKTTVCRTLLNKLDSRVQTALITNTHIDEKDLLEIILEDLEVNYTPGSKAKLLSQLNQYLIEQLHLDNNVVLIIDEAQNLKPEILEEIRMLSNLETETEKLIQIILLGQPELKKKLGLGSLEQLRQRVVVFYHLAPLTLAETKEYIQHRVRVASLSDRKYFTDAAMELIYQFTKGTPRIINQLCDRALLTGFVTESEVVDEKIIQESIGESPVQQIEKEVKNAEEEKEETEHLARLKAQLEAQTKFAVLPKAAASHNPPLTADANTSQLNEKIVVSALEKTPVSAAGSEEQNKHIIDSPDFASQNDRDNNMTEEKKSESSAERHMPHNPETQNLTFRKLI